MNRLLTNSPYRNGKHHRPMRWQNRAAIAPGGAPFTIALAQTVASLWSAICCAIAPREKESSGCRYYGHIVADKTWTGPYPTCGDCGASITDSKLLRRATTTG